MNQKVKIVLECDTELVGEILAAAHDVSVRRHKDVVCTAVEHEKGGI